MIHQEELVSAIRQGKIEWSVHALRRMLERDISRNAVLHIICNGEVIESYPDDHPFPSALFYGRWEESPLHAIVAYNKSEQRVFIISSYQPDTDHFEPDFKTRRKK